MLSNSLLEGLQIVLIVTVMATVISPILYWVLSDRIHPSNNGAA